ncbi:hypothetical protein GV828_06130 [Flavobacterium sp. NST-5]|uniref:Uncharacterized protein n=2 Tax=Flavobacterium ichthyis TaxID=2698827 RepID=A0ABW9Z877_9FLAO|nr:hypothetical protein [Flavobacterium ichthyis]
MPYIIVTDKVNKQLTYFRNIFRQGDTWHNLSDINLTPISKKFQIENIGIGWEVDLY